MTQIFTTEEAMKKFFEGSPEMELEKTQTTANGILAFYYENVPPGYDEPQKNYLVYAREPSGFLYVTENGTSCRQAEGKKFSWSGACSKSYFMSQDGEYGWDIMKV